jgi:hypothetical protein
MIWYGLVWYGLVWSGMVWYGLVWSGMSWYGLVWSGLMIGPHNLPPIVLSDVDHWTPHWGNGDLSGGDVCQKRAQTIVVVIHEASQAATAALAAPPVWGSCPSCTNTRRDPRWSTQRSLRETRNAGEIMVRRTKGEQVSFLRARGPEKYTTSTIWHWWLFRIAWRSWFDADTCWPMNVGRAVRLF